MKRVLLPAAALLLVAACGTNDTPAAAPAASNPHSGHTAGSAPPAKPLRGGERFVDLALPQPYTPKAPSGGTDDYRCFLVDPGLTENAYLTGSQFQPQNAAIVHHAIFYRLDPTQATEAAKVDEQTPGEGWTCFGDSGVQGQTAWVAHWAPGAGETLMPAGSGFAMPPGSKLVMQVHYNLLEPGAAGQTDQSGIKLRVAAATTPLKSLSTELFPAPIELPCAAGESGPLCDRDAAIADVGSRFGKEAGEQEKYLVQGCSKGKVTAGDTQHCDQPVEEAGTIYMAAGHMHLLGRSIKIELNPGKPGTQTILDVPQYNFDNQALVPLAKPIAVKPGDTVRVTCTHDAKLRKMLPQLRQLPPRYVVWGEGTSDEMCLGILVTAPTT
ncbi:monooxygenase [Actinoplanes oblitus]|uniref:Monooxygenase n=1 Tax=Actinoplanes oblitus TaxID=3040509 RepID=A0ABY8W3Z0_9ACTN|nr:monooxygenase [Actinoplanes oblitus]WIM92574.1 monooxygenase [Actinoplanes oblitus]